MINGAIPRLPGTRLPLSGWGSNLGRQIRPRACLKNGARLCRRPAASEGASIISRDFMACCGWSRTTQPRSMFSNALLSSFGYLPAYETPPSTAPQGSFAHAIECRLPSSCAGAADALRQSALIQAQSQVITRRGRQPGQALVQLQHKGGRRQGAHRNCWVTTLQPPQRVPAYKEPT